MRLNGADVDSPTVSSIHLFSKQPISNVLQIFLGVITEAQHSLLVITPYFDFHFQGLPQALNERVQVRQCSGRSPYYWLQLRPAPWFRGRYGGLSPGFNFPHGGSLND